MNLKEYILEQMKILLEDSSDELNLHGKTMSVKTDKFHGDASLKFHRIVPGKHKTHEYYIQYKDKDNVHTDKKLQVFHNNGDIYKYKTDEGSSSDLQKVLDKSHPKFVTLSDLENATKKK